MNIKEDFHHLIDTIDDEQLLNSYYQLIQQLNVGQSGQVWNTLTDQQKNEVLSSYEESFNENNLIPHEQVKQKHDKWLKL
jgi:hypothetical protein